MKRIGILTTHRANNFGAVLQAYSLVMACRELGSDAEILDWRNPYFEELYHHAFRPGNPLKRNLARAIGFWSFALPMRRKYDKFRKSMPSSAPIFDRSMLARQSDKYDAFIVGSDQVWNPRNSVHGDPHGFDRANLLDFAGNKPRFAYAASIGTSSIRPADLLPEFKSAWEKFKLITMREHEGAEYVSNILGKKIDAVLDPVMLHDTDWWRQRLSWPSVPNGKFVFLYNLDQSAAMLAYAREVAAAKGAQVICPMIGHAMHKWHPGLHCIGPEEFVALVANAEAVVTRSFHASAFSVLFGKELHLALENAESNPNTRFSSLARFAHIKGEEVFSSGSTNWLRFDCRQADGTAISDARNFSLSKLNEMVRQ